MITVTTHINNLVVVSNILYFHNRGDSIQVDEHILQVGWWTNQQLDKPWNKDPVIKEIRISWNLLQGGPLLVINGVITSLNGLING